VGETLRIGYDNNETVNKDARAVAKKRGSWDSIRWDQKV